jgi:hypothetical protein
MGRNVPAVTAPARPDWYERNAAARHPAWCGRGHLCGLGEHRAQPVTIRRPGAGAVVLTRVANGSRQYAEVRMRVELAGGDDARDHLMLLLAALEDLLERVDVRTARR